MLRWTVRSSDADIAGFPSCSALEKGSNGRRYKLRGWSERQTSTIARNRIFPILEWNRLGQTVRGHRFGPRVGSMEPSSGCWTGTSHRPLLSISSRKVCEPAWRSFHKGRFKLMVPTSEDRKPDRRKDNAKQRHSDLDCPRKLPLRCESGLP
jgi:hypothetical protein